MFGDNSYILEDQLISTEVLLSSGAKISNEIETKKMSASELQQKLNLKHSFPKFNVRSEYEANPKDTLDQTFASCQ